MNIIKNENNNRDIHFYTQIGYVIRRFIYYKIISKNVDEVLHANWFQSDLKNKVQIVKI